MDERQELNAGRAALLTLTVVVLGALGVLAWEYVTTKNVTNMPAVLVMMGGGTLFVLFERMFGAQAPRSILGVELPTGQDAADTRTRRRSYLLDALLTAAGLTVLGTGGLALGDPDALDSVLLGLKGTSGLIVAGTLGFIVMTAITFGLNLALGESQSRSVERRYARLEATEAD